MADGPAVSILLPVANVRDYLPDAARSVLNQSFADLELILIDDAGRAEELARESAAWNDARVRVLACDGKGIADALNTGLAAATGTIWCRCDADDLFPPDRLSNQVAFLHQHPEFGAVCGSMWAMSPAGAFLADMNGNYRTEEITDELRRGVARSSLCTWAVRMELMRGIGGFRRYFITAEDIDAQFRLAERSRVFYEARLAYHYRLHDTSTTHTQPNARRIFFDKIAREFQSQRLSGRRDDLERGCAASVPSEDSPAHDASSNTQLLLIGASWEKHRHGQKAEALRLGWQACRLRPANFAAWRSLGALMWKRAARVQDSARTQTSLLPRRTGGGDKAPATSSGIPAPPVLGLSLVRRLHHGIARRLRRVFRPVLRPLRDWQAPRLHRWMMHEASLPMTLTRRSALIVAPHHDDETFGCGGLIALKREQGIDIQIVIMTDGGQSHGNLDAPQATQLTRTRRDEALAAVEALGVGPENVTFLDLPDQGLSKLDQPRRASAIDRLADLLRAFSPGEVYVNHRADRHPDHEATFRLFDAALTRSGIATDVYEYPIWLLWKGEFRLTRHPPDIAGALRLDVRSVQEKKERAIAIYGSQLPVLPPGFVGQFQQGYEVFFRHTG